MRFSDKVVFVTGAGRGIGRAIARRLVEEGARVWIADRERRAAAEVARALGDHARASATDVSDERAVRAAITACVRWGGRLDGVVNDAALAAPHVGPIERLSRKVWDRFLAVNLTGTFLVAKHAVPHLRRTRGAIVNLGSTRAVQSEPHTEPYAATKGGVMALTHALAQSLGPDIRVNCVSPGWIHTGAPGALRPADHAQHPVGRVGRPEDIAGLVAYLLSEEAGFITGQQLIADGGMTRKMIYAE